MSDHSASRARILDGVTSCERELDERNLTATGELARSLDTLRTLASGPRLPRVAIVGRRGAGKSSLINALASRPLAEVGDVRDATGNANWYSFPLGARPVRWCDTPGLRAGGRPDRRETILEALAIEPPDLLVVVSHASEVDAAIDTDLEDVRAIGDHVARAPGRSEPPPILAVVTRVDDLAPPDVVHPPFDDREKRTNVREAVSVFGRHLRRHGVRVRSIVPAATYVRFERGAIVVDRRWNIDLLAARIDSYLPTASQLEGRIAGEELRAALDHAMRAITESFAHRAAETGRALTADPVALRAELSSLRGSLIRVLTAMTPQPEAPSSGWLDTVAGPEGALEGLRALLRWARAERASGAIAALQFRATGASVRRSLLG